jgi:hypothetical protein
VINPKFLGAGRCGFECLLCTFFAGARHGEDEAMVGPHYVFNRLVY